jgi:hypothetical protein
MIKYVESTYLDIAKYDQCISLNVTKLVYGFSWYLNAVCPRFNALVLNDYDAVMPLPVNTKMGINYFYRPFGVQQLGVFSKKTLSREDLNQFLQKAMQETRFFDICLNEGQNPLAQPKLKIAEQRNQMLGLNRSYQDIYKGYSTNLKRKLKKIDAGALQLFESDGPDVVLQLFKENKGAELGLSEDFYRGLKKLMYQLQHKGLAKILTVYGGPNMLLGALFFLEYEGRSTLLVSGVNPTGKEYNAMAYLINEYIIFNAEKKQWLDFEGSNNKGLARFYESFGAKDFNYPKVRYNNLPKLLAWFKK